MGQLITKLGNLLSNQETITALVGVIGTLSGVLLGWLLSLSKDFFKSKIDKKRTLESLLSELTFNQGLISYGYLDFDKGKGEFLRKHGLNKKADEFLSNMGLKFSINRELGLGFKTSAYRSIESRISSIGLPLALAVEIDDIYRKIFLLEKMEIPQNIIELNPTKLNAARKLLKGLEEQLTFVIDNFNKNRKEYIEARKIHLKKINSQKGSA